jgi:hypothetical protein
MPRGRKSAEASVKKTGRPKKGWPKHELLQKAQEIGHEWCVLPPEAAFPHPTIGFRLMQYRPELPPNEYGEFWVRIQTGGETVLKRLADSLNAQRKQFPQLYDPAHAAVQVGKVMDRLEHLPRLEE